MCKKIIPSRTGPLPELNLDRVRVITFGLDVQKDGGNIQAALHDMPRGSASDPDLLPITKGSKL